jgi:proteasome lid subunit RPN8/RPN11
MISIGEEVTAAILQHARQVVPHECCGLLIGHDDVISRAVAARNRAADPTTRYVIDPRDHFAAVRAARAQSLDVIGGYHSHPRSTATPSATDAAEAFSNFLFLIVGLGVDPPQLTAWRWIDGNFDPVPLVRVVSGPR